MLNTKRTNRHAVKKTGLLYEVKKNQITAIYSTLLGLKTMKF